MYDGVAWLISAGRWAAWRRLALDYVVGTRVLELGFGTGALMVEGRRRGWSWVGLDLSAQMQRIAHRRLARQGLPQLQVQGRAEALPFAHGAFDTVVATFPAEYLLAAATLAECARVLACTSGRRGRLVVGGLWVTADLGGWERMIPAFYGAPGTAAWEAMVRRLAAAGFATERVETEDGFFRVGIVIAKLVDRQIPTEPTESHG
jgi:SAM-dependent methyltransferase